MNLGSLKRLPTAILLVTIVLTLSLVAQANPVHRAAAQSAGTNTATATGTPGTATETATATATGTTVAATETATATGTAAAAATSTATATAAPTATTSTSTGGTGTGPALVPTGICGTITSFTPATGTTAGSITISNVNTTQTFPIAPGVTLAGAGALVLNGNVCISFTLSAAGTITAGSVSSATSTQLIVCGATATYTPATLSALGSLTVGGITFPLALGTTFATAPTPGTTQQYTLTLNGLGLVTGATITAGTCTGTTVQGPFTTFTPPTATTAGSITIGGVTFTIAAGTTITATHTVPLAASLPVGHGPSHHLSL